MAPSECTPEHVIRYLVTGKLPLPDVLLHPDGKVFDVAKVAAKSR